MLNPNRKTTFSNVTFPIVLFVFLFNQTVASQKIPSQNLKGQVIDMESQIPLPGATVVLPEANPPKNTITDPNGYFIINDVPVGRYSVQISFLGYKPITMPEVLISSGKEVSLHIELEEDLQQIAEVVVKANSHKDRPLNSMATVSARSFSVEETRRYAGGLDDPARMASAFAGVSTGNIQDNAIVIRGNSPRGVLWQLEGVPIINPNHFADGNVAGGGAVTIFSSQLLANSDFFTGAFPAEYGNALAGVFDMKFRSGNADKHEYTFQAGLMGIDLSAEGPFSAKSRASYLFNYRYSTFSLISDLNLLNGIEQIPKYQDFSFKINVPTEHVGIFSLWGIGAIDENNEPAEYDSTLWETDWDRSKMNWNLKTTATGISHKLILPNNKSYINSTIAFNGKINDLDIRKIDSDLELKPETRVNDNSWRLTLNSFLNIKLNAKHTIKTGVNIDYINYSMLLGGTLNEDLDTYIEDYVDEQNTSVLSQYYIQTKHKLKDWTINGGLHFSYFSLNNSFATDPRVGLRYDINPRHALSLGYGKHSQLEELRFYFITDQNGNYLNKQLDFSKAHHFVLAYDFQISEKLRLKAEPFFQYLYDVPGIADSSFSLINFQQDWNFREDLQNNTTGHNIGLDLTLERFLNNNYYYLITLSLFDSKYTGDDDITRNSLYNKSFVSNVLFGKEFYIGKTYGNILGLNGRVNIQGGNRETPVLKTESEYAQDVVYNYEELYTNQEPWRYYLDFTLTYRINKAKCSQVFAMQIKNVLRTPIYEGFSYNYQSQTVERDETRLILPVVSYKVEF